MLIFDLETDGLLDEVTVIHCIHLHDTETGEYERYNNRGYKATGTVAEGVERLGDTSSLLAHNGIGYDYIVLDMLYPGWDGNEPPLRLDSLVLARLIWPDMREGDFAANARGYWKIGGRHSETPEKMGGIIGSHALKAWGYRFGEHKGDFNPKDFMDEDGNPHTWKTIGWTEEMDDYCEQDVRVTKALWELIDAKEPDSRSVLLEHQFATIINRQERHGFYFDIAGAERLQQKLLERKADIETQLQEAFPPWTTVTKRTLVPKRNNKTKGYVKGVPVVIEKEKTTVFNAGSRDHIANRLMEVYGWKPTEYGNNGKPKVDDTVLKALDYPPVLLLREYLTIAKRLGQLAEGRQAWLSAVKDDSRIHGRVNTNGAVTGRCTHSSPNVAQVPAVRAAFGEDCRSLFCVPPGYKLVGADASGLELRCLAHYMARWDDGHYGKIILESDIHTENQNAAGLKTRDQAKTFIYGFLYGAGDGKIGEIVGKGPREGKKLKQQFLTSLPALKNLVALVQRKAEANGFLIGLDGRFLHVRSPHAALNTLLQSAGALIMKKALCCLDDALQAKGLIPGVDYEFVSNVHDEWQVEVKEEHAQLLADESCKAMTAAGEYFKFRCPISGEAKIGDNWASTH